MLNYTYLHEFTAFYHLFLTLALTGQKGQESDGQSEDHAVGDRYGRDPLGGRRLHGMRVWVGKGGWKDARRREEVVGNGRFKPAFPA